MKHRLLQFTLLLLFTAGGFAAAEKRPNVLFVFADDLCYEAIRAYGHTDIDTPNLDRLSAQSANFMNVYNMGAYHGAVCAASRAMLNSGRMVWNVWGGSKQGFQMKQEAAQGRMWSQLMKQAGYQTYMTGKWHVETPAAGVFDEAVKVTVGMPKQTPQGYNRPMSEEDYENGWKPWEKKYGGFWKGGKHWSEVQADDGIAFFDRAAKSEQPFFIYLAFNAAHDPRQAPKEYVDRYPLDRIKLPENFSGKYQYADDIGCGKGLRDERLAPFPRTEYAVKVNRREYYAIITHLDAQIGRVFEALKQRGLDDNTYIIFTADHGLAVGHHGFIGKQNLYDHSVRVPFMISGPGIKGGTRFETPIYLQDAMPTALELAGAPIPDYVEFKSVLPLIKGERKQNYDSIYGAYMGLQRMVTMDGWKLIHYPTIGVDRLYNLGKDPQEMQDLAGNPEYAGRMAALRKQLHKLSKDLNDPLDYSDPVGSWKKTQPNKKAKGKGKAKKSGEASH